MLAQTRFQHGFNLIELIVVITVLTIIMLGTTFYINNSITAYADTVRRDQLASLGRITMEKVVRQLRLALPNSIRIQNNCLEFFPIEAASVYLNLPTDVAASNLSVVPVSLPGGSANRYVAVFPFDVNALYTSANPGPLSGLNSITGTTPATITLNSAFRFIRHSPYRRIYIVSEPISYCIVGDRLFRYSQYGINAVQAAPPASGAALLAENIQSSDNGNPLTVFAFTPGTLRRSGIVALDFRFLIDNEWIRLSHEVHIRNAL